MKITYLDNSGFYVALTHTALVFDYYNDHADGELSLDGGVVTPAEIAAHKNTYVFVSHRHFDHYNRNILNWQKESAGLRYIFDSGVARGNDSAVHLTEGGVYRDEDIEVKAFGSTDAGISFLVKAEGTTFFHAGDLNFWHWEEEADAEFIAKAERDFMAQLKSIDAENEKIDVMFFPCDYRMGENGDAGAKRMIEALSPSVFVPMHFQNRFDKIADFKKKNETRDTAVWAIPRRGAQLILA
jgi:L-ascorbate metabolism protein UlaG (beta-lactamase superfamily)